jgi:hypothetical protein
MRLVFYFCEMEDSLHRCLELEPLKRSFECDKYAAMLDYQRRPHRLSHPASPHLLHVL